MIFKSKHFIVLLLSIMLIKVDIVMAKSDRAILEQCRYIFDKDKKKEGHITGGDESITDQDCAKYMDLMKEALYVGSMLGYSSGLKDAGVSEIEIEKKSKNFLENYPSVFGICYYNSDGNRSDPVSHGFNEKEIRRWYNYLKDQPENSNKPISYLYVELMRSMFPLNTGSCTNTKKATE